MHLAHTLYRYSENFACPIFTYRLRPGLHHACHVAPLYFLTENLTSPAAHMNVEFWNIGASLRELSAPFVAL